MRASPHLPVEGKEIAEAALLSHSMDEATEQRSAPPWAAAPAPPLPPPPAMRRRRCISGGEAAAIALADAPSRDSQDDLLTFREIWERVRNDSFAPVVPAKGYDQAASEWGRRNEGRAIEAFRAAFPLARLARGRPLAVATDRDGAWLFCTPDAVVVGQYGGAAAVVEVKCPVAGGAIAADPGELRPRRSHVVQLLVQMFSSGAPCGFLVLWTTRGAAIWKLPFHKEACRLLLDGLYAFYASARSGELEGPDPAPPDPDDVFSGAGGWAGLGASLEAARRRMCKMVVLKIKG